MPTFRIVVAYDGTDFVGWQCQASGTSIQGLLQDAVRELDGRDVAVIGAGRTDAGVHALGQVAAFTLERAIDAGAVVRALNARLPDAVRVLSAEDVPRAFNPRFDARSKTYCYRIWRGPVLSPFERRYAWHLPGPLDVDAMRAAARRIEGRRDFAAFQSAGSAATTIRRILSLRIEDCGLRSNCGLIDDQSALRNPQSAILIFEVSADGFLRHMVRTIVGSLVEIGRGRRPASWMDDVIASRDRTKAGPTAPAAGLFLVSVDYGATLADEA